MSFTYEGDPVLAFQWLPFAKAQQSTLAANGVAGTNLTPDQNITILIRTNPNHIHIIAKLGGTYYFMTEADGDYLKLIGAIPSVIYNDGVGTGETTIKASHKDYGNTLNYGAPDSDRTTWYGHDQTSNKSITVLSGYGNKYLIGRFPHSSFNGGDIFSGFLELFEDGVKKKTASFHGLNGFVIDGELVAVDTFGLIKYERGDVVIETETTVPAPTLAVMADFIETWGTGNIAGNDYTTFNTSFSLQDPEIKHACNWQINKNATKAVSVSYVNYVVEYELRRDDNNAVIGTGSFIDIIPYLIEMDISITRDEDDLPTIVFGFASETIMSYQNDNQYLIAADYNYYPPRDTDNPETYEPAENELVMMFVEFFSYAYDGQEYEGSTNNSTDSTLVIKSKTTEFVRDKYSYNHDLTTGQWKGINGFRGEISSIDLRSMSYGLIFKAMSNVAGFIAAKKVVFRGVTIFDKAITSEGFASLVDTIDYTLPSVDVDNTPNWYFGFQDRVRLDNRFSVDPFNNRMFSYQAWSDSAFDLFLYTEQPESTDFIPIFNYHINSNGASLNPDDLQCTANVLVI